MPRKYVKKTSKRKTIKRGKRTNRKFTRKTAIIRNPLSQNSIMVPMQYPFAFTYSISAPNPLIYSGSCYPNSMGIIPAPDPILGNINYEMPVGLAQYGAMYQRYRVHGSSVDLTVTNLSDVKMRVGLLALPFDGTDPNEGSGTARWAAVNAGDPPDVITCTGALSGYQQASYVDLLNDPFIKWRTIHESTNPRCQTKFRSSRKTKNVIGVKDLKDAQDVEQDIISTDYEGTSSATALVPAKRGFCWMIKNDTAELQDIMVQGKITYYVECFQRVIVKNPDYNVAGPVAL